MDDLATRYCYRTLAAHGLAVGLTDGLMGNSEVGYVSCSLHYGFPLTYTLGENRHLNIGAGRIVWQDIVRIDQSIKKRQFHQSPKIVETMQRAKEGNGRLHLLGLVSRSGGSRFSSFRLEWVAPQPRGESGGLNGM
jgi:2,3-bisphosphoglycerate-independent phosphoglycerate mutase